MVQIPPVIDGYGRSGLDWSKPYPPLFHKLGDWCQAYLETPREIQFKRLAESICNLSESLLESDQKNASPGFHELGHCLMFLQESEDACIAFQQHILKVDEDGNPVHGVVCNLCDSSTDIKGTRFVCKSCPDQDLCEFCVQNYEHDTSVRRCRWHRFLHVPGPDWKKTEVQDSLTYGIKEWLKGLVEHYGECRMREENCD